jgi:hypothetical protein
VDHLNECVNHKVCAGRGPASVFELGLPSVMCERCRLCRVCELRPVASYAKQLCEDCLCARPGCEEARNALNSKLCTNCTCMNPDCGAMAIDKGGFCATCKCAVQICPEARSGIWIFCESHHCSTPGCEVPLGSSVQVSRRRCINHICVTQKTDCTNERVAGGRCCESHQCWVFGCTLDVHDAYLNSCWLHACQYCHAKVPIPDSSIKCGWCKEEPINRKNTTADPAV